LALRGISSLTLARKLAYSAPIPISIDPLNPNFKVKGQSGQISFSADGDQIAPPEFVQVLPGSQSGFGYYFVPLRQD
jgi:hypothetical protein